MNSFSRDLPLSFRMEFTADDLRSLSTAASRARAIPSATPAVVTQTDGNQVTVINTVATPTPPGNILPFQLL
jgi:hypothetical protein